MFRARPHGVEWGVSVDVTTFRFDQEAGHEIHVYGTGGGEPLDIHDVSGEDDTRVTMVLPAFVLRWPMGRTEALPSGRWRPYAGAGYGLQHAHVETEMSDFTTNGGTFHVLGGADVLLSSRDGLFGEYRFERVGDEVTVDGVTTDITFRSHHAEGGVSIHF